MFIVADLVSLNISADEKSRRLLLQFTHFRVELFTELNRKSVNLANGEQLMSFADVINGGIHLFNYNRTARALITGRCTCVSTRGYSICTAIQLTCALIKWMRFVIGLILIRMLLLFILKHYLVADELLAYVS